jgi:hypothetical protein
MTIRQILEIEKNNLDHINLFFEGPYWRAYEHSAHMWVRAVGSVTARRRFYKTVSRELAVVAIATSMLDRYLHRAGLPIVVIERGCGRVVLRSPVRPDRDEFPRWKSSLEQHTPRSKPVVGATCDNELFRMIRTFDIELATPAECVYFVRDLKLRLGMVDCRQDRERRQDRQDREGRDCHECRER